MGSKVITDTELRAHWISSGKKKTVELEPNAIITPAAQDFIRENGIAVTKKEPSIMTRQPVPFKDGHPVYFDPATSKQRDEKGETMTLLHGNVLIPKTDPRIAFRGKMDTLQAQFLCLQSSADERSLFRLRDDLGELLSFTREILGCEVKEETLHEIRLLNMDSKQIRSASHHVKEYLGIDHPIPSYTMGSIPLRLNLLRTQIREAELSCLQAFSNAGVCEREDLVEGLNRLSSCVYILFCRMLAGYYG